ncbi:MAG TPA: DUF1592 domain-containing protein [Polyangiaceae bacterium]|nr:DUF1592 domain-containing protein [Polyangiaceae bacterium]
MRIVGMAWMAVLATAACGNAARENSWTSSGAAGHAGTAAGGSAGSGSSPGTELVAVPGQMRRLSGAEYGATVSDVLGAAPPMDELPRESSFGFDNIFLSMRPETYATFFETAEEVAAEVMASESLKGRVLICTAQDDAACVRSIISNTGLRLFRRPLFDEEIPVYEKVYSAARTRGELHEGAVQQVLFALLSSSQFLYRMEFLGEAGQPLGPYELATRLSYLLWSSAPDDTLLTSAESSALSEDAELEAQLTRMWEDPRSARFVENFGGQWLGARELANHVVDPTLHPEWTAELAHAAEAEVHAYFDEFLRQDLDYLGFLDGRSHYVNAPLGALYGLDVSGDDIQRVVDEASERAGFLGLVAFLTRTSNSARSSPTRRGLFILQHLLCSPPPPPPPAVDTVIPPDVQPPTIRDYFEQFVHTEPSCAACHLLTDPLGFALEQYDEVGRFRTNYANGIPPNVGVMLPPNEGYPDGLPAVGLPGVSDWVAADRRFKSCLVEKLYTYGLARNPDEVDEPNLEGLTAQWEQGPLTIKAAVSNLVLAKPFRFRDGDLP